jgi:phosphate transport system permease protein
MTTLESHPSTAPQALRVDMGAVTEATTLPVRPTGNLPGQVRRQTRQFTKADIYQLSGSFISAMSITLLLFGRLTSLDGALGFVATLFALFLVIYSVMVSLTESRPAVIDRVMTVLLAGAAVLALFALFSVILFVLWKGHTALFHSNFFKQDMSSAGPLDPLTVGGITHAIVGTLIMTFISLLITVPLGVACAVFLNETGGKMAGTVRTVVTAMTALPSILAGLFIFATWILVLGMPRSGLAAAIAMSIMILPIIIRSADVVLRLVPGNLREASSALGAPHWRTVWHVVLPTARSGLTTSVILGVARGVGETAPVLLTAGFTSSMNTNPFKDPMVSLPLAALNFVRSPQPALVARGFATAAVLMILVLVLFTTARMLGGRPAGRQSKRQAKRAKAQSLKDMARIDGRSTTTTTHTPLEALT